MKTKTLPAASSDVKIQTIFYCLCKLNTPSIDKLKLVKLIFLADKHHLLNHARTITDDTYYALPYGPVCSGILDILNDSDSSCNPFFFLNEETNQVVKKDVPCKFDMLSDTDKNSLDTIIDKFAKYETRDIVALTHKYPEWKTNEKYVKMNNSRVKLYTQDLVSIIPEDGFNISEKKRQILREIINQ